MKFDELGRAIAKKVYLLEGESIEERMGAIIATMIESSDELRDRPYSVVRNEVENLKRENKGLNLLLEDRSMEVLNWEKRSKELEKDLKATEQAGEDIRKKNGDLLDENKELKKAREFDQKELALATTEASNLVRTSESLKAALNEIDRATRNAFAPCYEYDNNDIVKVKADRDTLRNVRHWTLSRIKVALQTKQEIPKV